MKSIKIIFFITLVAVLPALPARADLDVVFLLDTTGSMSSEIREVKERVVQLSTALKSSRAGETVRFGVVAYRDREDKYITKISPLTDDVQESERFLALLTADGGGDAPEDVLAGLHAALTEMEWANRKATDRQIFLIGDAPPHLDYKDGPKVASLIRTAQKKRVVVNAIGCRSLSSDGIAFFRQMSLSTEGCYQHIGRVRSGEQSVADAMLNTLVSKTTRIDDSAAKPVSVAHVSSEKATDSKVVLVSHESATPAGGKPASDKNCYVSILLPVGTALEEEPVVSKLNDKLIFSLRLQNGSGEKRRYRLADCTMSGAPIHVRIGGAK